MVVFTLEAAQSWLGHSVEPGKEFPDRFVGLLHGEVMLLHHGGPLDLDSQIPVGNSP